MKIMFSRITSLSVQRNHYSGKIVYQRVCFYSDNENDRKKEEHQYKIIKNKLLKKGEPVSKWPTAENLKKVTKLTGEEKKSQVLPKSLKKMSLKPASKNTMMKTLNPKEEVPVHSKSNSKPVSKTSVPFRQPDSQNLLMKTMKFNDREFPKKSRADRSIKFAIAPTESNILSVPLRGFEPVSKSSMRSQIYDFRHPRSKAIKDLINNTSDRLNVLKLTLKPVQSSCEPATSNILFDHTTLLEQKYMFQSSLTNTFEEWIELTRNGQLWHFPIDNDQDNEEVHVPFHEHVFLGKHLKEGFPKTGPIANFMRLVCIGLSQNAQLTVQEKIDTIDWYRQYFADKVKLVDDLMKKSAQVREREENIRAEAK